MNLTYKERQELNELSLKTFGTTSKWQKLLDDGVSQLYTREREVMVPKANGEITKKTFTDKEYRTKRYTVEEVRKAMVDALEAKRLSEEAVNKAEDAAKVSAEA